MTDPKSRRRKRLHLSNLKSKGRICEVRRSWGSGKYSWDNTPNDDDLKKTIIKMAKTRHPYSGDTRKLRLEYRFPRGFEKTVWGDEYWEDEDYQFGH